MTAAAAAGRQLLLLLLAPSGRLYIPENCWNMHSTQKEGVVNEETV